ncbi:MAG: hypothetical protein ABIB97_05665 [Patescibacteria group bacterium]
MTKKILTWLTMFLIGGVIGFLILTIMNPAFENLGPGEMLSRIIEERDLAISKAVAAGDYGCCINPPCTMCFMEANQWNNHQAGTCACDQFIARGEKPCPQCQSGLIRDTGSSCEFTSNKCE